ncbi:hypothetical protein [Pseudomonas syringae]|uniref:hypothetical protein n=1 Tax=Pseudomonas syringae TaxID=317 RepID=UPI0013C319FF|nr:hypothetical protein [Pseudomonas syringae]
MDEKRKYLIVSHETDMGNGNKGTLGKNITWDKNQGEHSRQITEQRKPKRC